MREILFRAKILATESKWVEGFYNHIPCGRFMCDEHCIQTIDEDGRIGQLYTVYDSTVGQFTGLTDKNGKKIFEGDIVRGRHWTSRYEDNPEIFHLWCVDWNKKSGLIIFKDSPTSDATLSIHDFADFGEVEVIGNIHDNPELLEVE